ncbi:DUF2911 domain-containing protein [Chryseotalea sanaruensis]|uniref:DUF2911 domain-containing protein n=2 Tax=Chryseotalea sanaruensis TaxID=2482724 RepID=A0A401U5N5_9BACT|nr:DUF2911 domain-containing protein [Chryseotalea sanaruensis]
MHIVVAQHVHESGIEAKAPIDTTKKSIPKEVHAQLGDSHHMIYYYAPAVRGRDIWGGLVPYGEVWVTGAHRATHWQFDKDIMIGTQRIPAGKYGVFTIPGKKEWVFILNKNWDQHLADDYDQNEDIIRIKVKAGKSNKNQERLAYYLNETGNKQNALIMSWEKIRIKVSFANL